MISLDIHTYMCKHYIDTPDHWCTFTPVDSVFCTGCLREKVYFTIYFWFFWKHTLNKKRIYIKTFDQFQRSHKYKCKAKVKIQIQRWTNIEINLNPWLLASGSFSSPSGITNSKHSIRPPVTWPFKVIIIIIIIIIFRNARIESNITDMLPPDQKIPLGEKIKKQILDKSVGIVWLQDAIKILSYNTIQNRPGSFILYSSICFNINLVP